MDDFDRFLACSFDCYGTLIDWERGISTALEPWCRAHGVELTGDDLVTIYGRHENVVEREHPTMPYPDVVATTLDRVGAELGVDVTREERRAFGASVGDWPAFADSTASLRRLAERFRLVVLSNVDRESFARSQARLGVTFDLVLTADEIGSYKPSPRNFDALVDGVGALGVERDRLLHVAQSRYHDHEPARAAGLATVWIDRRHDRVGPGATPPPLDPTLATDWRYESLHEFADAVGR